jgi:hypothetical protein
MLAPDRSRCLHARCCLLLLHPPACWLPTAFLTHPLLPAAAPPLLHLPALLQVYTPENMHWHFGMRKNGQLLALVNSCPRTWVVGGVELKVAGIGGVCSHPVLARGAGYIQVLMNHVIDRMHADGVHLSFLGGIRQRYAYYGYDKCGLSTTFSINRSNVRRYFAQSSSVDMRDNESSSAPGMRLAPMEITFANLAATDMEQADAMLAAAQELQRASPAYNERGDDFALLCGSGLTVAMDSETGEFVGYLVAGPGSIREMEAISPEAAIGIVSSWCLQHGAASGRVHGDDDGHYSVALTLPQWHAQGTIGRMLGRFAETVSTSPDHNWKVLDWPATVGATLALRAATAAVPLAAGAVTLILSDIGTAITMEVDGSGRVSSVRTAAAAAQGGIGEAQAAAGEEGELEGEEGGAAVISTDSMTALRLLFGPLPPEAVLSTDDGGGDDALAMLSRWCPLPLYTPPPDSV